MQVQRMSLDPKFNAEEASIVLASPTFDPRLYLRLVHQYTSYEDLIAAQENLQAALNLRRETLKSLVKQNFDRFVNAKNSIDAVYADMRVKGMNSGDFGMRPTASALNGKRNCLLDFESLSYVFSCSGKSSTSLSSASKEAKSGRLHQKTLRSIQTIQSNLFFAGCHARPHSTRRISTVRLGVSQGKSFTCRRAGQFVTSTDSRKSLVFARGKGGGSAA